MKSPLLLVCCVLSLAGCSAVSPPRSDDAISAVADESVAVIDVEILVGNLLTEYVEHTNDIIRGGDPESMREVTTPEWAIEELKGFDALRAMGVEAPLASVTRFEVTATRGRNVLVDAIVAVCFGGGSEPRGVSMHAIPRNGDLVVSAITPWEDSSWCTASPSL